jgi:hypothetical protein
VYLGVRILQQTVALERDSTIGEEQTGLENSTQMLMIFGVVQNAILVILRENTE